MSIKQIALIEITRFGSDVGLYVDGSYVTSADPGCGDSTDAVISMAENLAASQNLAPDRIQVAPDEEWQWDDVSRRLQEEGKLRGGLSEYLLEHTVLVVGEDGCELDTRAMKFQAEDQYHAIEQMVDHYRSMRTDDGGEFLVRVSGMDWDTTATLHQDGYPITSWPVVMGQPTSWLAMWGSRSRPPTKGSSSMRGIARANPASARWA